ncbi:hypothetical protein RJ639_023178 [Escallonia herrerae]|uniref:inorganic diphosphatase n=1 Tax=Escallonia herrerae TaxID=1293975 RepID=A0AA89AET2_9ASTE|nr:hypothetical protein RJ639_023178 [Escallonia herrerae]
MADFNGFQLEEQTSRNSMKGFLSTRGISKRRVGKVVQIYFHLVETRRKFTLVRNGGLKSFPIETLHKAPDFHRSSNQNPPLNERILSSMTGRSVAAHPWHDLEIGAPTIFNCVVEISKGSKVDRVLYSSVVYPHNYGVLFARTMIRWMSWLSCRNRFFQGAFFRAKAIGLMPMIDQSCADDPEYKGYTDIKELPPHLLAEIRRFFEDYKKNENKEVAVDDFLPATKAYEATQHSMNLYADYIVESLRAVKTQVVGVEVALI